MSSTNSWALDSTDHDEIAAALTLFAENGYARTTVGIEAAAGFTPRGGALYKHFSNKDEVLQASPIDTPAT